MPDDISNSAFSYYKATEPPFSHEIVVYMGEGHIIHSFEYTPRQGSVHPRIKAF